MNEEKIKAYIIRELGRHKKREDVIYAVCEKTGLSWAEAQRLVYEVAYEGRKSIAARQSPLVIIFGSAFVIGGFGLAIFSLVAFFQTLASDIGIPDYRSLVTLVLGLAMMAGGIIGLWEKIRSFFE